MPIANHNLVITEMRIGAAEHDLQGFRLGFSLGKIAFENSEYWQMSQGRKFMPQSMQLGYDMGRNVAAEARIFEAEIDSREALSV